MIMLSATQIAEIGKLLGGAPFMACYGPAQVQRSKAGNEFFMQDCVLYDTAISMSERFTHIFTNAAEALRPGDYVKFDVMCLSPQAMSVGDGKARIILQLRIPPGHQRLTLASKVA
jgi:hypothetical protein